MLIEREFTATAEWYPDVVYCIAPNWFCSVPDVEDAARKVMLRLRRRETDFADENHLRYWLTRVTLNVCKDLSRSPWCKAYRVFGSSSGADVF